MHESVLLEEDLLGERPGKHSNMTFQINFIRMLNIITGLQAIRFFHSYTLPNLWFGDLPWLFFYRKACWNILQCLEYIHKCWGLQVLNKQLHRQRYNLKTGEESVKKTNQRGRNSSSVCLYQSVFLAILKKILCRLFLYLGNIQNVKVWWYVYES